MTAIPRSDKIPVESPFVKFEIVEGGFGLTADLLAERFIGLEVEDLYRKTDKVTIRFEDADGILLEPGRFAVGLALRTTWGYPGATQTRLAFINRIRGGVAKPRGRSGVGRGGEAGVVEFEGYGKRLLMHAFTGERSDGSRLGPWTNIPDSDIVKEFASLNGFSGAGRVLIEPTGPSQLTRTWMRDETTLQFLKRLARENGYAVYVSGSDNMFHFHSDDYQAPVVRQIVYLETPDVISFEVDGDFALRRLQKALMGSFDPIRKYVVFAESQDETGVFGTAVFVDRPPPEKHKHVRARESRHVANPAKLAARAATKVKAQARKKWKLKLTLVGDPIYQARRRIELSRFGPTIDGTWLIHDATHRVDAGGYVTVVKLTRSGLNKGGGTAWRYGVVDLGTADASFVWRDSPRLR